MRLDVRRPRGTVRGAPHAREAHVLARGRDVDRGREVRVDALAEEVAHALVEGAQVAEARLDDGEQPLPVLPSSCLKR